MQQIFSSLIHVTTSIHPPHLHRTDEGVDVTDEDAVRKAIKKVKSDGGAIDVVINNAGYFMEGCEKVTDDSLDVSSIFASK